MTAFFDDAYLGNPPWDIGRPQREFVNIAGEIRGNLLDVGCGTGEHVIYFAERGHESWGVDASPRAIAKAKKKAEQRNVKANFLVWNALELRHLKKRFDSIIDCGLFHTFSESDRLVFASSLAAALKPGGAYYMLCFSEKEPTSWGGPRRVSQKEIRETFNEGWEINFIREARFETNHNEIEGWAWLSSITRI